MFHGKSNHPNVLINILHVIAITIAISHAAIGASCSDKDSKEKITTCLEGKINKINERLSNEKGNIHTNLILPGTIVAWYPQNIKSTLGADGRPIISAPAGWVICDGNNHTPDLRSRFIMGTTDPSEMPKTGGASTHHHTGNIPTNSVSGSRAGNDHFDRKGSGDAANTIHGHGTIATSEENNLPPYYRLVYIMKQ